MSSSGPTDMDGSKMAPTGSTKEAVRLELNVMFSLARYLVLEGGAIGGRREGAFSPRAFHF